MNQTHTILKIYDTVSLQIILETQLTSKDFIGKLKSNIYSFQNGHIYFRDSVVKIRYDLIDKPEASSYTDTQFLDEYEHILQLNKGELITTRSPVPSWKSEKLAYVITNQTYYTAKKILILPYLHDRKLFLNRQKNNTHYFYTSIETRVEDLEKHEKHIDKQQSSDYQIDVSNFDEEDQCQDDYHRLCAVHRYKDDDTSFTSIICINLTEYKFYVYS